MKTIRSTAERRVAATTGIRGEGIEGAALLEDITRGRESPAVKNLTTTVS